MKASTILKLIERAREPLLKEAHIKAYAEAMIEKDRERVIESLTKFCSDIDFKVLINKNPIILD